MDISANVLTIGKTGSGKSSLINYLFGQDIRKAGAGKPVTQEVLFKCDPLVHKGFQMNFFDTKGIENLDIDNWLNNLELSIQEYENSDNIADWFHAVFYCISAATNRIEDFEIQLIKNVLIPRVSNLHIIITQCDSISNEALDSFEKVLTEKLSLADLNSCKQQIKIFRVCSVKLTKRNGTQIIPYGKDEIVNSIFEILWEKISFKLPEVIVNDFRQILLEYSNKIVYKIGLSIDSTHFYNLREKADEFIGLVNSGNDYRLLIKELIASARKSILNFDRAKKLYENFYLSVFNEKPIIDVFSSKELKSLFKSIKLADLGAKDINEIINDAQFFTKTSSYKKYLKRYLRIKTIKLGGLLKLFKTGGEIQNTLEGHLRRKKQPTLMLKASDTFALPLPAFQEIPSEK